MNTEQTKTFGLIRPLFLDMVEHTWAGSYLIKNRGAHFRKYIRILSKKVYKNTSAWTGGSVWSSPIIPLAPPA